MEEDRRLRSSTSSRSRTSQRQPSATPLSTREGTTYRDPRHRRFKPVVQTHKPEKLEQWLKVLDENTKLIVDEVTWSNDLVEDISESMLTANEARNVKIRRGQGKGNRILDYLKEKSYEHFVEFLDLLSDHGYNDIKAELWKDLIPDSSTPDDDIDSQVDSFMREKEEKHKSDQLRLSSMEKENKELRKELEKRDKEMQTFMKGLIETVKDYAECKTDTGPTVTIEMKTCSNIIKSAFSQLARRIQTAESSTSKETVQRLEKEIQSLTEINSKQESRLLKYERQMLEAREDLEVINRKTERKDRERAKSIEYLNEQLREKQDEIAKIILSHREDMARINEQFEEFRQKHFQILEEHDRKLSAVTKIQKENERKITDLKTDNENLRENMKRSESRMEARVEQLERLQREKEMTSENLAQLPRLVTRSNSRFIDYSSGVPGLTVRRMNRPNAP